MLFYDEIGGNSMKSYDDEINELIRWIKSAGAYLQENAEDIVYKNHIWHMTGSEYI